MTRLATARVQQPSARGRTLRCRADAPLRRGAALPDRAAQPPAAESSDGGFRPDGTFVPWPAHDAAAPTEAFRRAVLRAFVRRGVFEPDDAAAMLAWPHSGFHVHDAVWVPDGDTAVALRLARYYGWYANRVRGRRRAEAGEARGGAAVTVIPRERVPFREVQLRWAELLRRIL